MMLLSPRSVLAVFVVFASVGSPFAWAAPALIASPDDFQSATGSGTAGETSEDLPSLGKWMVDRNGQVAHWLGQPLDGKPVDEPINVVLRVSTPDPVRARALVFQAARRAGFPDRVGHSNQYAGLIDGTWAPEADAKGHRALSDRDFLQANNHGRIFGAVMHGNYAYFTAAFSREGVKHVAATPERRKHITHVYVSFNQARDRFVERIQATSPGARVRWIDLGNQMPADAAETTGDHDGRAALIELP